MIGFILGLSESWKKTIKFSVILFVLLFSYIYLFAVDARDYEFLLVGGSIGFASSVSATINDFMFHPKLFLL